MRHPHRSITRRCRCWRRMGAAVLVVVVEAFAPTILHNTNIHMTPPSSSSSSSSSSSTPSHAIISDHAHTSASSRRRSTQLFLSDNSNNNNNYFDQTQYTDAAWSAIVGLPPCSNYYSSTSVDAPMLLSILLNPTKYQVPNIDNALTAKTVVTKLLTDAGVTNIDIIKRDVEKYLEKQPKVSGDTSTQKSLGRVLGEVLEAARGVKDGLKVRTYYYIIAIHLCWYFRVVRMSLSLGE